VIGSLRGVVLERRDASALLVEVGGVGYRVTVTPATLGQAELGAPLFLHVHTHVREDALVLYGFATRDERDCFEALLGAHGVGPALALAMLAALAPVALRRAVATDDVDVLTAVPGVGRKTAARLLIELKSRLDVPEDEPWEAPGGDPARSEVRVALAGLGYGPAEVRDAVRDLPAEGSIEELLTSALRQLASAR
jgi:Holliday junction DNA helicase RuvA